MGTMTPAAISAHVTGGMKYYSSTKHFLVVAMVADSVLYKEALRNERDHVNEPIFGGKP
jgi:hypothetical protein